MGQILGILRAANTTLIYLSGVIFIIAFLVLVGVTYYITGKPFGTVVPDESPPTYGDGISSAGSVILLATTYVVCYSTMGLLALILIVLFCIKMGLGSARNK